MKIYWNDIKSEAMNSEEYLNQIQEKEDLMHNYNNYAPNENILTNIRETLSDKGQTIKIFAIGADWCHDCADQMPRLVKIKQNLRSYVSELKILYGVKTNPFHKEDESKWHKKYSPPEATDPRFNLQAIPSIYIFNKRGEFIGRIVEHPKKYDTLEEELFHILDENL